MYWEEMNLGKHFKNEIVKVISISDLEGNPVEDWRINYVDTVGLLSIYESEHKAPGKYYAYYFPNEPENLMQRYFNTSPSVLTEKDNMICLERNHIYTFEIGDYLSDDELTVLLLNIDYNR